MPLPAIRLMIAILLIPGFAAYAAKHERFRFQHVIGEENSPTDPILAVAQDRHGFMWFAGQEVYRFDGRHIRVYLDHPSSDCAGLASGMVVDTLGVLWLASNQGVCYFNESLDRFIKFNPQYSNEKIHSASSIKVDNSGTLYIGLSGKFATISASRERVDFFDLEGIDKSEHENNQIQDFFFQNRQIIWMATSKAGLVRYDKKLKSFQYIKNTAQNTTILPSNNIWSLAGDAHGNLWFGMNGGGVSRLTLSQNKITHYYNGNKKPVPDILYAWHVLVDSHGLIWVSSDGGGLMLYQPEQDHFKHYQRDHFDPSSIKSNKVIRTFEDRDKNLWISLFPSGMDYIDRGHSKINTHIKNLSEPNTLNSSRILSIHKSKNGQIWVGTEEGLNLFDAKNNTFIDFSTPLKKPWSIGAHPITFIKNLGRDKLWVGTWGAGLYLVDLINEDVTHFRSNPENSSAVDTLQFWDALVEHDTTLFATEGIPGLLKYDHTAKRFSRERSWGANSSFNKAHIFDLHRDHQGFLWIATTEGLFKINKDGDITLLSGLSDSKGKWIPSHRIRRIFEDRDSTLWIGTEDLGIFSYHHRDRTFNHIAPEHWMTTLEVNCIDQTGDGWLWFFTKSGIIKIEPHTLETQHLHRGHGLISDYFYRNGCFIDEHDRVFAGGANGLSVFYADQIPNTPFQFPVHITSISVFSDGSETTALGYKNALYTNEVHLDLFWSSKTGH